MPKPEFSIFNSQLLTNLMDKYPGWSPYNYVMNNPLVLVDPDGMRVGDYYSPNESKLGTDKIKDGNVYVEISSKYGIYKQGLNTTGLNLFEFKDEEGNAFALTTGNVKYFYHTHSDGRDWVSAPSERDRENAGGQYKASVANIVLRRKNNTVYFFNGDGIITTIPFRVFRGAKAE